MFINFVGKPQCCSYYKTTLKGCLPTVQAELTAISVESSTDFSNI